MQAFCLNLSISTLIYSVERLPLAEKVLIYSFNTFSFLFDVLLFLLNKVQSNY